MKTKNIVKEMIASLETTKKSLNSSDQKKLGDIISLLKESKVEVYLENQINWASAKVIEIVTLIPSLMQDKNKGFKEFCNSLHPTKINLPAKSRELFFGTNAKSEHEEHDYAKSAKNFKTSR